MPKLQLIFLIVLVCVSSSTAKDEKSKDTPAGPASALLQPIKLQLAQLPSCYRGILLFLVTYSTLKTFKPFLTPLLPIIIPAIGAAIMSKMPKPGKR
ncbi:hypothetical protein TcasGA2_TC007774 [Tribolium castaneum]|uniref:Uncharacterized protein n=1 Tax=Tribolium castaneum TaxID=7070 RepID=D2A1U4_TRICA|nr:hypothetical protein TcasGA2_TC007774 [Tribolium castaneum]